MNAQLHVEKDSSHVLENVPIQSRRLVEGIVLILESQLKLGHAVKWRVKVNNFFVMKFLLVADL